MAAEDGGVIDDDLIHQAGGEQGGGEDAAGLVDEIVIYYAPILCGNTTPALAGSSLPKSLRLIETDIQQLGDDIRVRGVLVPCSDGLPHCNGGL